MSSYCYPFCHFTEEIRSAVVHAGYQQARWGANESYYSIEDDIDQFKIDCRLISKFGYERVRGNFIGHLWLRGRWRLDTSRMLARAHVSRHWQCQRRMVAHSGFGVCERNEGTCGASRLRSRGSRYVQGRRTEVQKWSKKLNLLAPVLVTAADEYLRCRVHIQPLRFIIRSSRKHCRSDHARICHLGGSGHRQ